MKQKVKRPLMVLLAAIICVAAFPAFAMETEETLEVTENPQVYDDERVDEEEKAVSEAPMYADGDEVETYEEDGILYFKLVIQSGEEIYFNFSVEEEGFYAFYGISNVDSFGWLKDKNMNLIAQDDDSGEDQNFKFTAYMEAGETYYYGTGMYNENTNAPITVAAQKVEIEGDCGSKLWWNFEPARHALYIGGSGEMKEHPWTEHLSKLIRQVYIEDGVTSICDDAFFDCPALTTVSLPESLDVIGFDAFNGCYSLENITIPSNVYAIGTWAFHETPWAKKQGDFVIVNGILIEYQGKQSSVTIPKNIWGIGTGAFWDDSGLTNVTIPSGVEVICEYAFFNCTGLKSATIPKSVVYIGDEAFSWYNEEYDRYESVKKLTISGFRGTAAETYALTNHINFKALTVWKHATPALSKVENTASGVKLEWGKVSGAAQYRIFYKTGNGSWTTIGDTSSTSYTWKGAKSGTRYTFTVRCVSKDGKSCTSDYNKTGKTITYVAAPSISKLENVNGGVKLTWNKVSGTAKYRIFYKTGSGKWTKICDTTSTSYTWKKAKSGTKYTFTVRCISKDGKTYTSGYSATGKSIRYVAVPVLNSVKSVKNGVQVNWKKSAGAAKYRVFRKTGSGSWKKIGDTTKLTFTDKTAKKGVRYIYTVRCVTANGKTYTSGYNAAGKTVKR